MDTAPLWEDNDYPSTHLMPDPVTPSEKERETEDQQRDVLASIRGLPAWEEPAEYQGSVGRTMFDTPGATDNSVTVLLPPECIERVPAQSMVRITSYPDGRTYLGIVIAGPFAEPDGLRADAPSLTVTAVRGAMFMPRYHGRVQVEILGEQLASRALVPPRFRPLPNSPVFALNSSDTAAVLHVAGTIQLGVAAGDETINVKIDSSRKSVLPRHTGILGTTGGGKSTTVSRIIKEAASTDYAVILLDTEGEYTEINQPTTDPTMLAALQRRSMRPEGVTNTHIFTLVGKDTSNPTHPDIVPFTLEFSTMSPYVVEELLDLNDAQKQRFEKAYDATKHVLKDLGIFPEPGNDNHQKLVVELDEFDTGYPRMKLSHLYDIVGIIHAIVSKEEPADVFLRSPDFRSQKDQIITRVKGYAQGTDNRLSWRAVLGKVSRLMRINVFDRPDAQPLDYGKLLTPGHVSIFDLSDTDSPLLNNLVIADLLRGTQKRQDEMYQQSQQPDGTPLTKTLIIIEEAHEFLSEERLSAMPNLFQQVARIAKRGRKRWLSLIFVTQLPQHLPRQVLGLVNNFVLHKINDAVTISRLKGSIAGIDEALWQRLPGLAPGQAIVTFTSMTRPLLVAVDPAPAKLRMID
ncbi:ATP-binding protein [Acrocarpospora sp. B8E8]|uniref:ATP-binding protein n=1 Tax=Acrocarpospora sp. B8E8 TaxID=3153572 RepID=UPI00325D10FF